MRRDAPTIDAMLAAAETALAGTTADDRHQLGAVVLHILALHGRVLRALDRMPNVVGDDVPWAHLGRRDDWVASVAAALGHQRSRVTHLADLQDPPALLRAAWAAFRTLQVVAREMTGFLPAAPRRAA